MTQTDQTSLSVTTSFRRGESWADAAESPAWMAKAPPTFIEEVPELVLTEKEYDLPRSRASAPVLSVYVGGLDYAIESGDLEDFFRSKGCKVSRVRVVKQNGKSSGKAFLNVADKAALDAVVKLNGVTLSGRQLVVREDLGAKPSSSSRNNRSETPSSNFGGRWKEEKRESKTSNNGWSTVGGKEVAPAAGEYRKKRVSVEKKEVVVPSSEVSSEIPKERKKLELKPRSKPVGETGEESRSAAIFGNAKPRDETAFKSLTEETEISAAPVKRKEKKTEEKVQETVEVKQVDLVVVETVKPVVATQPKKNKKSNNRFALILDTEDEDDSETSE